MSFIPDQLKSLNRQEYGSFSSCFKTAEHIYEAWPGKSCTLLIFSLFDALSPLNFSNTFRNSNSVKIGAYKYKSMYKL